MKTLTKNSVINHLKIIILALILTLGIGTVYGDWTPPPSPPPTCPSSTPGCNAPLHIGADVQTKLGGLILGSGLPATGMALYVPTGRVGVGTSVPQATLDVKGPILASDFESSPLWGGQIKFASGETNPSSINLRMEKDTGTWGLRLGSDTGQTNIEFEVRGDVEVLGGLMKSPEICIGSDCRTSWPGGSGGGTLVEHGYGVSGDVCDTGAAGDYVTVNTEKLCKSGVWKKTITFSKNFTSAPSVIVSPELVSYDPVTPSQNCSGGATDQIQAKATNITKDGFILHIGGSPVAGSSCGALNEGYSTNGIANWMAIGS